MSERSDLLESISITTADYRTGEVPRPTHWHVERWVSQFDAEVQLPILREMDYVLHHTYITRANVEEFVGALVTNAKLTGPDAPSFWKHVRFLDIQDAGNSQRELLRVFDTALQQQIGLSSSECGATPRCYVYLDDAIFTGHRVRNDIIRFLENVPAGEILLHVVVIGMHRGGQYFAESQIKKAAVESGKTIAIKWWRVVELEDRKAYVNSSDVLRPTVLPDDELVQSYVASLRFPPILRKAPSIGQQGFFSTEEGRHLLEQEFLKTGVRIRENSPLLSVYQRPLGNMVLETLGFGSMLVTYRNCPNNAPLALWAGEPWYPLFPRKTN